MYDNSWKETCLFVLKSFNVFVFQRVYFFFFLGRGLLQTGVHANSAANNFVWEGPIKLTDVGHSVYSNHWLHDEVTFSSAGFPHLHQIFPVASINSVAFTAHNWKQYQTQKCICLQLTCKEGRFFLESMLCALHAPEMQVLMLIFTNFITVSANCVFSMIHSVWIRSEDTLNAKLASLWNKLWSIYLRLSFWIATIEK